MPVIQVKSAFWVHNPSSLMAALIAFGDRQRLSRQVDLGHTCDFDPKRLERTPNLPQVQRHHTPRLVRQIATRPIAHWLRTTLSCAPSIYRVSGRCRDSWRHPNRGALRQCSPSRERPNSCRFWTGEAGTAATNTPMEPKWPKRI